MGGCGCSSRGVGCSQCLCSSGSRWNNVGGSCCGCGYVSRCTSGSGGNSG